jgi:hypothetical protein
MAMSNNGTGFWMIVGLMVVMSLIAIAEAAISAILQLMRGSASGRTAHAGRRPRTASYRH